MFGAAIGSQSLKFVIKGKGVLTLKENYDNSTVTLRLLEIDPREVDPIIILY